MKEPMNIANAAVIIACLYFLINGSFGFWAKAGLILIILFAIAVWGYWTNPFKKEEKELIEARIQETKARTENFKANSRNQDSITAFNAANAIFLKERAIWLREHKQ